MAVSHPSSCDTQPQRTPTPPRTFAPLAAPVPVLAVGLAWATATGSAQKRDQDTCKKGALWRGVGGLGCPHSSGLETEQVPCKRLPGGSGKPGRSSSGNSGGGKVTPHQKGKERELQSGLQWRVLLPGVCGTPLEESRCGKEPCRALLWVILRQRHFRTVPEPELVVELPPQQLESRNPYPRPLEPVHGGGSEAPAWG